MQTIHYPVKGRKLNDVITQQTLDQLLAQWDNWQQAGGSVGQLNLHPCWGTTSVLEKGYQGESISRLTGFMQTAMLLYDTFGTPRWRVLANAMASQILYLQDESGAFIHSTAEFEPSFDTAGCPIHFFTPILGLCDYYQWPHADESINALIPTAVERHYAYMTANIWRIGCAAHRPLPFPGWCGVTNQDLVATAAIATASRLFDHPEWYERHGRPVLDRCLSDENYYKAIGLFERGDGHNFAERTTYYNIILNMLKRLYDQLGEDRLLDAFDNVVAHLFDAAFVGADGLTYLARGAITDPVDKTRVLGWEKGTVAFSTYCETLSFMYEYLTRHPSAEKQAVVDRLEDTLAAYVLVDGTLPAGLFGQNPLFAVAVMPDHGPWIRFVLDRLGDAAQDPRPVQPLVLHRTHKNFTWKQKGRLWAIEKDGVRCFGAFSRYPAGIVQGPEGEPMLGAFADLEVPDVVEIID